MTIITHVAISQDGKVFSLPAPNRHHDVIKMMAGKLMMQTPIRGIQGFLLSSGEFVDRFAAAIVALEVGQVKRLIASPNLYSEDLW